MSQLLHSRCAKIYVEQLNVRFVHMAHNKNTVISLLLVAGSCYSTMWNLVHMDNLVYSIFLICVELVHVIH